MRTIIFIWVILTAYCLQAQTLRGEVFDADSKKPIAGASIFLSSTGIGTSTKSDGSFEISRFPKGKFEFVVTLIDYETYSVNISSTQIGENLKIYLKPKFKELEEVVVHSYEKDGWYTWGTFFLEHFIGISAYAKEVYLKNPEVIRFRYDKKNQLLAAFAKEPLIIENDALGYRLRYDLIQFMYSFNTERVIIKGYPFFQEMETDRPAKKAQWVKNRNDVYEGSMMHFFRSLFRNQLSKNGFELRRSSMLSKQEEGDSKNVMSNQADENDSFESSLRKTSNESQSSDPNRVTELNNRKAEKKFEKKEIQFDEVISADSVAYAIDSITVGFYFKDLLQVTYTRKKEPIEISEAINGIYQYAIPFKNTIDEDAERGILQMQISSPLRLPRRPSQGLMSRLELIDGKEIAVWANGAFYESTGILSYGYWAFWERIATLLPLDFKPSNNKKAP